MKAVCVEVNLDIAVFPARVSPRLPRLDGSRPLDELRTTLVEMSCFLDGFESETLRVLSCSTVVRIHAVSALSALWCDRQPGLAERAHEQRGKEQKRECLSHKKTSHSSISRSFSQVLPGIRYALASSHSCWLRLISKTNDSVCLLMQKSPSSNAKFQNS